MVVHAPHNTDAGYFSGQLLIATPAITDGCFAKSVIYLCEHTADGAMGVIVNHPILNIRLGEILSELELASERDVGDLPVYFGGPVDAHRGFVLHSDDVLLDDSVIGASGIAMTSNIGMLRGMAEGVPPKYGFLALGYAGWTAGQLEAEVESGSWITAAATPKLIFETENEMKWSAASRSLGVDMSKVPAGVVGHA